MTGLIIVSGIFLILIVIGYSLGRSNHITTASGEVTSKSHFPAPSQLLDQHPAQQEDMRECYFIQVTVIGEKPYSFEVSPQEYDNYRVGDEMLLVFARGTSEFFFVRKKNPSSVLEREKTNRYAQLGKQFVQFCQETQTKRKFAPLTKKEEQLLFQLLTEAGFHPRAIYTDDLMIVPETGSSAMSPTLINPRYRIKIEDPHATIQATGWLEQAIWQVGVHLHQQREDLAIQFVEQLLELSVPFEPIQLTTQGDLLIERPTQYRLNGYEYFPVHLNDHLQVHKQAGIHAHCGGTIKRHHTTQTRDVLVCHACHLRVQFPAQVLTYGELRVALRS